MLAHAIVRRQGRAELFVDPDRVPEDVAAHLASVADISPPGRLEAALAALGSEQARVLIDPEWASDAVRSALEQSGARLVKAKDPCVLPKVAQECVGARGGALGPPARWGRDGAVPVLV